MAASMSAKTGSRIVDPEILANEIELGNINRMGVLLSNGADPDASNEVGMTALMRAVVKGRIEIVRLLLDHGADVNLKRSDGFTALLLAVFFGKLEIVRLLLDRGAESKIKTRFETSAEMWAMARGFHDIARLLNETRARQSSSMSQLASAQLTKKQEPSALESQTTDPETTAANALGEKPTQAALRLDGVEASATMDQRSPDTEIVPATETIEQNMSPPGMFAESSDVDPDFANDEDSVPVNALPDEVPFDFGPSEPNVVQAESHLDESEEEPSGLNLCEASATAETALIPEAVETTAPAEEHAEEFAEELSNFYIAGAPTTLDQLLLEITFDSRPADGNAALTESQSEDATKTVRRSHLTAAVAVGEKPKVGNSFKLMLPKPIRTSRAVRTVSRAPNLLARATSTWTRVAWLTVLVMLVCGTLTYLVMVVKTGRAEVERSAIKSQASPGSDQLPRRIQAAGGSTSVVDRSDVTPSDKRAESDAPTPKKSVQDSTARTSQNSSESSHSPVAAERSQTKNATGESVANQKRPDAAVRPALRDYSGPSGLFTILSGSESSASDNSAKKPKEGQSELRTVSLDLDITRARTVTPSSSKSNGTSKSDSNRSGTLSSGSNEQKKKNQ